MKLRIISDIHCDINSGQNTNFDLLSAAFASNLEYLFERYPNIKLWCHGHVHNSVDYKLGNARVIANPLGYGNENANFRKEGVLINTDDL